MLTTAQDETLPLGVSKMGGLPDLPANFVWPYYGDKPLTFIGQFRLSELAPHDTSGLLPKTGRLYFFYEADEAGLFEVPDRNVWRLAYIEDEAAPLVRTVHPTFQGKWGLIQSLPAHAIRYVDALSMPIVFWNSRMDVGVDFEDVSQSGQSIDNVKSDAIPAAFNSYWEIVSPFIDHPLHFWFGHPCRYQNLVEREAVIESEQISLQQDSQTGLYHYTDEQLAHIQSQMQQWQFLFQIDTDASLGVTWGETGSLYICIPKASLANRQFQDCWTIMQCT